MNKVKYTIPLLALIMLIPVGMNNSFAQEIPGGEELESREVGPVGDVGAYLDILHQQKEYQYMSIEEQEIYNINAIDFMVSENNYEEQRNILLQKLSIITLEIQSTEDDEKIEKLYLEYDYVFNQLEDMGVTTYAKYQENPEYFSQKYQNSFDEFNDTEQPALVTEVDFRYIDTDDVSLKNKATIYFLVSQGMLNPYVAQFHLLVLDLEQLLQVFGLYYIMGI